jgi:hypothetical protein
LILSECLTLLATLTSFDDRSDTLFLIDQMLEYEFLDIAYGVILNSQSESKQKLLWLLDNLTLDSEKMWRMVLNAKYLFNAIVDLMKSNDIKLR